MALRPETLLASALTIIGIGVAPFIQPPWILSLIIVLLGSVFYLIRRTKYPALALMVIAALYGAQLLSLFVLLGTVAIVVLGELAFLAVSKESYGYPSYFVAATAGSLAVMLYLGYRTPLVAVLGVLVALMLKSALKRRYDSLMVESLGVAMTMFLFEEINFEVDMMLLLTAVITALSFGYFSYKIRAADLSGLFSGAIVGILLIVFADVRWFFIVLTFFILGSGCTRYRYSKKQEMGVAEAHGGMRGYFNVFANLLVAVSAAVLYGLTSFSGFPISALFVALFLGSVSSAAADTVSSEIGVVGRTPYLITTMEPVPHGTNGGITLKGEVAGFLAAIVVAAASLLLGIASFPLAAIVALAGLVGTNVDSVVGATLENTGKIGNSGTNFIATFSGGVFALLLSSLLL